MTLLLHANNLEPTYSSPSSPCNKGTSADFFKVVLTMFILTDLLEEKGSRPFKV